MINVVFLMRIDCLLKGWVEIISTYHHSLPTAPFSITIFCNCTSIPFYLSMYIWRCKLIHSELSLLRIMMVFDGENARKCQAKKCWWISLIFHWWCLNSCLISAILTSDFPSSAYHKHAECITSSHQRHLGKASWLRHSCSAAQGRGCTRAFPKSDL